MSENKKAHNGQDKVLKLLFSHPVMIEHLIKGFVREPWAKDLNFATLEKINVKHITDDLRERESDIIWKIDFKKQPFYIICLLEFQSNVETFMAVRILTYAGLVYQDLIKQKNKLVENQKLPPLFSFVFYTGTKPWDAPVQLKHCLSSAIPLSLRKYQPNIEFMVLDIGQIDLDDYTFRDKNFANSLIELEKLVI